MLNRPCPPGSHAGVMQLSVFLSSHADGQLFELLVLPLAGASGQVVEDRARNAAPTGLWRTSAKTTCGAAMKSKCMSMQLHQHYSPKVHILFSIRF